MKRPGIFIIVAMIIMISSCVKDPKIEIAPVLPSVITFNFQARVKQEVLQPSIKTYTNASKDSFTVTKFSYYISNLKLTREDGSVYSERDGYHLIEHVEGKTSFSIDSVPEGNYTRIEFIIGVDSAKGVSGAKDGDLDPARGMFWNWAQGYIFFKLDGSYNSSNVPVTEEYAIHVGGFNQPNSCLQTCSFSLINPLTAKSGKQSSVNYNVQIDEIFVKPKLIGFDYYYGNITNASIFKDISVNYRDMFIIDRIEN